MESISLTIVSGMMGHISLKVTTKQRQVLEGIIGRPSESAGRVRRVRVILLSAEGVAGGGIVRRLDLSPGEGLRVRARFPTQGVDGMGGSPRAARRGTPAAAGTVRE